MNKTRVMHGILGVLLVGSCLAPPADSAEVSRKKLQIFLLAGQSNMTGYCGIMPLTNLANFHELEDPALRTLDERLCKVVFPGEDAIRRNNERRSEIYRLLVETQDARKLLDKAKKDKDESAAKKLEGDIMGVQSEEYGRNMSNLIRDLRKDLNAPDMLVVCGTPSYDHTEEAYEAHPVVLAQRAVGKMPEFKGNVAIVETLQYYDQQIWPLWPKWKEHYPEWHMVGSHMACHYLGSGRFFTRLGDSLSTAMVGMIAGKSKE